MRVLAALWTVPLLACSGVFPVDDAARARARADTDQELLIAALHRLESWHSDQQTGLAELLNPGASEEQLIALFEPLDVTPTDELIALWTWHDGESSDQPLIWYHDFLSAREALREYRFLIRNPLVGWDRRFVPVFTFEGEWYAVYCGQETIPSGPVVHYFIEDEPRIAYVNLTTLFVTMAEVFESGAVMWDEDRRAMTEDIAAISRVHQKHNAGYSFPYHVDDDN